MARLKLDPNRVIAEVTETVTRKRNLEPWCPTCGASEEHPYDTRKVLIRGYKVSDSEGDWSQCLVCSGYYDRETLQETPENNDPEKGWFTD